MTMLLLIIQVNNYKIMMKIAYYYKAVNHFDPALTYLSERLRDNLILLNYQFKIQVPFFLSTSLPQTSLAAVPSLLAHVVPPYSILSSA